MARLVLPQADGKAPAMYFDLALGGGELEDQHVLGQPALVAGHHRGDAQGEALLAEQGVAAVARAVAPDLAGLGEVDDVLVVGVARPRHVGLALGQRRADRVQARHQLAVAEHVEGALAHAGHDPHAHGDVGRVGELHADVGDGRAERAHGERHHVQRAALHGARVEPGHARRASPPGARQLLVGPASSSSLGADERAVLDAGDVGRVGVGPVASSGRLASSSRVNVPEATSSAAQPVVLLGRAVAPVDRVGLQDGSPLVDPVLAVAGWWSSQSCAAPDGGGG